MPDPTFLHSFYRHEAADPHRPMLRQPFGQRWEVYTWGEVGQMARRMANHLIRSGMQPGSHVGLISKNCREWVIADLAIMMAQCISVPLFATLNGDQIAEVIELGDLDFLFVGKVANWGSMRHGIPDDLPIVHFPHYEGNDKVDRGESWTKIMETVPPLQGSPTPDPDGLWTIIFTSGTTGTPKGVMLSYANARAQLRDTQQTNPLANDYDGNNIFFSFLPLNHIAERGVIEMSTLAHGGEIAFTESIERFPANLRDIRPTLFFAVPRIWTKLRAGVLAKLPEKKLDRYLKIPLLSWFIKRKIKRGLGLDRSRRNITGAAAISTEVKAFFDKVGIPLSEAYGMTENFATSHMIFPGQGHPGSVGRAQAGTEHRIDPATGELLTKAAYTMEGYYKSPEKTAETLAGGWLHTGDQARIDEDGFLYLTGRVKDTFKTAKAKFIVPREIENEFAGNPDIDELCLLGLGMPQPVLIVSPAEHTRPDMDEQLEALLATINTELPSYKRVAAVVIADEPFSIENGLLTPTLKVKRPVMHQRYKDRLAEWIERGGVIRA